jgi:hypothetical protein
MEGFKPEIEKYKGIQVVSSLTAKWRRDEGMRVMNDILTAHPDLNAVMAMNDEMALGALEALRTRGKLKQMKLVGFNGAFEAIQQVYRGNMAAMWSSIRNNRELFVHWAENCPGRKRCLGFAQDPHHSSTIHIDSGVAVVDQPLLEIKVGPNLQRIISELKKYAN